MKKKISLNFRTVLCFVILAAMGIFIALSDKLLDSVRSGLNLYVVAVLPSMLPFFFFSKLLTELGFAATAGSALKKPLSFLYGAPPASGYVLAMSMLCGYPVGAKLLAELYEGDCLASSDVKKVAAFTSTSGPLFIVGAVGVGMFENKTYGFILLLAHYIGTLLNGLIYRGKRSPQTVEPRLTINTDELLNKCMLNAFLSVGIVGGFIVIFNLAIDMLSLCGVMDVFGKVFGLSGCNLDFASGVAGGLIEMTKGCLTISQLGLSHRVSLPICEFLITFGGMSVTFQSLAFLSKTKISPALYLLQKFTQGILCSVICFLLSLLI